MKRRLRISGWRLYDALMLAAILLLLLFGVWEHYSSRSENRRAIVKLARAQCDANDVLERASLARRRHASAAEIRRVHLFFERFDRPVNVALLSLGAQPCRSDVRR